MGYYTKYDLQIKPVTEKEILEIVDAIREKDLFRYVFDSDYMYDDHTRTVYFDNWEEQKWYNHVEDMEKLSKQFPSCVFKLECYGEDGETWIVYYQDGRHEICVGKIVYDEPQTITWPR